MDKLFSLGEIEAMVEQGRVTNLYSKFENALGNQLASTMRENERLKQFIYDIFVQCLNDFGDPFMDGKLHEKTMKHCYNQINAFAKLMPDWDNWNKDSDNAG